jgi:transposase
MTIVTFGLDLGKNWIHMVGLDGDGRITLRRRVKRDRLLALTANMPACVIGMEACSRAHLWGGFWRLRGDTALDATAIREAVRQVEQERLPDAEANAEAVQRPTMRFVPIKESVAGASDDPWCGNGWGRTALINQLRAILLNGDHRSTTSAGAGEAASWHSCR